MRKFLFGMILVSMFFGSSNLLAEMFRLESGLEVEGEVINQDEQMIVLQTKDGKWTIPKDMIDRGDKVKKEESKIIVEYMQPQVELFFSESCPYCQKMRAFLTERGISYSVCDVNHSRECNKRFYQLGGRGVPLTKVGSRIIRGYNPQGVLEALR